MDSYQQIRLAPGPLLVQAHFRDLLLSSRLLGAPAASRLGRRAPHLFRIGGGPRADAPVSPDYVDARSGRHTLVEGTRAGWVVNLAPTMRAELRGSGARIDDAGATRAPLALSPGARLRVPCGQMVFEVRAAGAWATLPRPWLGPAWLREGAYALATVLALLLITAILLSIPPDAKALSLDDVMRAHRFARMWIAPPEPTLQKAPGTAPQAPVAARPRGGAGAGAVSPASPRLAARAAAGTPERAPPPRNLAEEITGHSILGLLRPPAGSALAAILADGPALGSAADDVLAHLTGVEVGSMGGMFAPGTGAGPAGTGEGLLGDGALGTVGGDPARRYGRDVARLAPHVARPPEISVSAPTLRGGLDRDIVRRIVRRHLNEVRFCYEEQLLRRPALSGRLVVQFAIAGNGQVLSSVVQSSSMDDARVDACVVAAVRRWEFPQPRGGGLVVVSYPFQLQPAGQGQ